MSLKDKTVAVLAENMYEDLELWYPTLRLREEGIKVLHAGTGDKSFKSKHGYPVEVDCNVKDLKAGALDGLIIPGGYAPDHLRRHESVINLVYELFNQNKLVAAICHGGWVLASAGVIRDKKLTGFFSIKDDLINAGATYLDQEFVRDENLITSRKPDDLPVFCREIISFLKEN